MRTIGRFSCDAGPEITLSREAGVKGPASRTGAGSIEPEGSGTLSEGREDSVIDRFALIGQNHDGTIGPLMVTLGAAGIIDRNTGDKSALAGTDLGLEKFPTAKDQ